MLVSDGVLVLLNFKFVGSCLYGSVAISIGAAL